MSAPTSKLDRLLASLPDTEADLLRRCLESPDVGHVDLAEELRRQGHDVSEVSVRRWRRGA